MFIKFHLIFFNKTALHIIAASGNAKICKYLLMHPEIDVNERSILIQFFLMSFHLTSFFNKIQKKTIFLMTFQKLITNRILANI